MALLETLHLYQHADGSPWFWRVRLKDPKGQKQIRSMCLNGSGYEPYEPHEFKFDGSKPLYRLPELGANPDKPVWFCEGEKCVDRLEQLGVLATTSGSCTSASKADFTPLANRTVFIWPDNDKEGLNHAVRVADKLLAVDAKVRVVEIYKLGLPDKGDVVDWLEKHPHATVGDLNKLDTVGYVKAEVVEAEPAPHKSQATRLVEFAKEAELFHAGDKAFASFEVNGHLETWPIHSQGFRKWLSRQYYLATHRANNAAAMQDAISCLDGRAHFEGEEKSVHKRLAEHDGRIYIDLVDEGWRAIEVDTRGWRVIDKPPVRFIRAKGMQALPVPVPGQLSDLFKHLNISKAEQCLVTGWLVAALRPSGPYGVMVLQGEQGSCKSTFARVLRALVDPSIAPLRSKPTGTDDLIIAALNSWVLSFDNLSGLERTLSDNLCKVATGTALGKRQLFTDEEEVLIVVMRPIVINGISVIASEGDLISRGIFLNLETLDDCQRKPEADFWPEFEADRPGILGALLDRVSRALRDLPTMQSVLPDNSRAS
jgi:hypothetical protein